MTSKTRHAPRKTTTKLDDIESLYMELLRRYYEEDDRPEAKKVARRLEAAMMERPEMEGSIRAEEIRSLLAELRGDLAEAIRCREAEIRKILELHTLALKTPHWSIVARQYDYSDVSDRLDLLATLYDEQGDLSRAIATLQESQRYCQSHGIPFDGHGILADLQHDRPLRRNGASASHQGKQQARRRKLASRSSRIRRTT